MPAYWNGFYPKESGEQREGSGQSFLIGHHKHSDGDFHFEAQSLSNSLPHPQENIETVINFQWTGLEEEPSIV